VAQARARTDVEAEMKERLGLVPSFFGSVPDEYLDFEWELFKRLELGDAERGRLNR
jgi:hypothetical protein